MSPVVDEENVFDNLVLKTIVILRSLEELERVSDFTFIERSSILDSEGLSQYPPQLIFRWRRMANGLQ